ncbi:matrixin family metalloprotease [Solicola sp. PLA-1-18]|uniref:matrixin family metalloprotease n=1 Tax=Solicola sp. PLA-1-18 TaxID=3380532 RepID=UPI003B7DB942
MMVQLGTHTRRPGADDGLAGARRRRRRATSTLAGIVVLVGTAVVVGEVSDEDGGAKVVAAESSPSAPATAPAPPSTAGPSRAATVEPDGYEVLELQADGSPIRWSSCHPIPYVVSGDAPRGSTKIVAAAVAKIERATGLDLVSEGRTTEVVSGVRPSWQPDRYGARHAPVLISWTDEVTVPGLKDLAGYALPVSMPDESGESMMYVTGTVTLDRDYVDDLLTTYGAQGRAAATSLVMHELGHLMGLDHVDDRRQVMHAESFAQTRWGDGDRRGLTAAGAGPCLNP